MGLELDGEAFEGEREQNTWSSLSLCSLICGDEFGQIRSLSLNNTGWTYTLSNTAPSWVMTRCCYKY